MSGGHSRLADRQHVVYRIYDANRQLLYVGLTANAEARFKSHRLMQDWWPDVRTIEVEHFEGRAAAEEAERATIRAERPLHNRSHQTYEDYRRSLVAAEQLTSHGRRVAALVPVAVADEAIERDDASE